MFEPETLDRRAAAGLRFWEDSVDFGIDARQTEFAERILSFGAVVPMRGLSLSARPDAYGDYRFEGDYVTAGGVTARALRVSDTSALRLAQRVESASTGIGSVFADAVTQDDGGREASVGRSGERVGDYEIDWRAETGAAEGAPLACQSLGRPVAPGVVRGYQELSSFDETLSAYVGVSLDLAYADGAVRSGEEASPDMRSRSIETVFAGPDGAPPALSPNEWPEIEVDGAIPLHSVDAERTGPRSSFLRKDFPPACRGSPSMRPICPSSFRQSGRSGTPRWRRRRRPCCAFRWSFGSAHRAFRPRSQGRRGRVRAGGRLRLRPGEAAQRSVAPPSPQGAVAPSGPSLPISELAPRRGPVPVARRDGSAATVASGPDAASTRPAG